MVLGEGDAVQESVQLLVSECHADNALRDDADGILEGRSVGTGHLSEQSGAAGPRVSGESICCQRRHTELVLHESVTLIGAAPVRP